MNWFRVATLLSTAITTLFTMDFQPRHQHPFSYAEAMKLEIPIVTQGQLQSCGKAVAKITLK